MKEKLEALDIVYGNTAAIDDFVKLPAKACVKCGRVLNPDTADYVTIQGNLYFGEDKGVIGDNIPQLDGTDKDANKFAREDIEKSHVCIGCLEEYLMDYKTQLLTDLAKQKEDIERTIDRLSGGRKEEAVDIPDFLGKKENKQ